MTLFDKVTWPWIWPSPSVIVDKLQRSTFFSMVFLVKHSIIVILSCAYLQHVSLHFEHFEGPFKVTWPWRTRTRAKATVLAYVALSFLTQKNRETKTLIDLACLQPEIGKVPFKVKWPWRTRSRVKVTVLTYVALSFLTRKTRDIIKVSRSVTSTTRDKNHVIGIMTSCYQIVTWRHVMSTFSNFLQ